MVEKQFVQTGKPKSEPPKPLPDAKPSAAQRGKGRGQRQRRCARVPLTTRMRADFAKALKRASLERQLSGQYPNTILDILEEALEPWLRSHGYLS